MREDPLIVLTADRTLMSRYRVLFDGMVGAAQTTSLPEFFMARFVSRPMPEKRGRPLVAPLGLRRVEAALLEGGFTSDQIAIVSPQKVTGAMGAGTRILGISSGDPLGLGMNDETMRCLAGGRTYMEIWVKRLGARLQELRKKSDLTVIFGGSGAWQLIQNPWAVKSLGVDVVFLGYAEGDITELCRSILAGRSVPPVVHGKSRGGAEIPPIHGPTSMGVVEVSRGCGWGCPYCTMADEPMVHLPLDTIIADVDMNIRNGVDSISLVSEDFFRFGAFGSAPKPDAILKLVRSVRSRSSLKLIQLDHVNVNSTLAMPEPVLVELHDALVAGIRHDYLWVNIGVETASGDLLRKNNCAPKMAPYGQKEWGGVSLEAVKRLCRAGFLPMVSLILGLPGEKERHLRETLAWVEDLAGERVLIFPLFYAPLAADEGAFTESDMTPLHWRLLRRCYDFNFRWVPRMYGDNLRGAGEGWMRRAIIRTSALVQTLQWKWRFSRKSRAASHRFNI